MHYANRENHTDIIELIENGLNNGAENAVTVLGSVDNTEMLPDLSCEIYAYMKATGYYSVWQKVSVQEIH